MRLISNNFCRGYLIIILIFFHFIFGFKYEIINRSSDELEKLNLADKLDQQSCPSGREVKEKTESAIEIIEGYFERKNFIDDRNF